TLVSFAGGNSSSFTAPTTNPRIDLLVLNSSGALERVVGTEAASPTPPTYPTDKIVICEVFNRVGQTSVKNVDDTVQGYISKNVRPFLNLGVSGAGSTVDQKRLWGCNIKPNTTTKIDVETGIVEVDTVAGGSPEIIELTAAITMDFATVGANGLDTGTPAISWYHFFVIYNPTTQTIATLASQNQTSPTMPSGYTKLRRVGTFYNTAAGSASIRSFKQIDSGVGRRYLFDGGPINSGTVNTATYASFSLTAAVSPTADVVIGYMNSPAGISSIKMSHDGVNDQLQITHGNFGTGTPGIGFNLVMTIAQTIYALRNAAGGNSDILVVGYEESV
ncbi:hypothetical protein LCGC14_2775770, partial [marine sediment metagenome]